MSERLEHLKHLVTNMLKFDADDISRADFDELQYLASTIASELPQSFFAILNEYNSTTHYGSEVLETVQRLDRVLTIAAKYPSSDFKIALSEELLPTFSLEDDDKSKVIKLCAQMREIVTESESLDDPHRRRLLRRISGIEHQVHQPKGILDVICGGVADVGETLGRFGKDIKPLTDRMSEISKIARKGSKEYDQLPPPEDQPRLPPPEEED